MGHRIRTKHSKVLLVLEKQALRYRSRASGTANDNQDSLRFDNIDEMGTVDTTGLTDDDSVEEREESFEELDVRLREMIEAAGVDEEILKVHGVAPGSKAEGVIRLIYENLNGLNSRMSNN